MASGRTDELTAFRLLSQHMFGGMLAGERPALRCTHSLAAGHDDGTPCDNMFFIVSAVHCLCNHAIVLKLNLWV